MAITAQQAADVARKHGLSLQDAAGLVTLADSVDDADRIAQQFADQNAQFRESVRKVFNDDRSTGIFSKGDRLTGRVSGRAMTETIDRGNA